MPGQGSDPPENRDVPDAGLRLFLNCAIVASSPGPVEDGQGDLSVDPVGESPAGNDLRDRAVEKLAGRVGDLFSGVHHRPETGKLLGDGNPRAEAQFTELFDGVDGTDVAGPSGSGLESAEDREAENSDLPSNRKVFQHLLSLAGTCKRGMRQLVAGRPVVKWTGRLAGGTILPV